MLRARLLWAVTGSDAARREHKADVIQRDLIAYLTRNCCAGSTVCDPACVPVTSPIPQFRVRVAQVERPPRKRRAS